MANDFSSELSNSFSSPPSFLVSNERSSISSSSFFEKRNPKFDQDQFCGHKMFKVRERRNSSQSGKSESKLEFGWIFQLLSRSACNIFSFLDGGGKAIPEMGTSGLPISCTTYRSSRTPVVIPPVASPKSMNGRGPKLWVKFGLQHC